MKYLFCLEGSSMSAWYMMIGRRIEVAVLFEEFPIGDSATTDEFCIVKLSFFICRVLLLGALLWDVYSVKKMDKKRKMEEMINVIKMMK